jgi:hypothetical protein
MRSPDLSGPKMASSAERKIARLTREIAEIDHYFYGQHKTSDRRLYAGMLEHKRDDFVRATVLQIHTAIEDILNLLIIRCVLGIKAEAHNSRMGSTRGRALRRLLYGAGSIGFDMKLNVGVAIKVLNAATRERLMELNTLRNRCSHNWVLKGRPIRRGRRPAQTKSPLLQYRGRDLHKVDTLKSFYNEYGGIYVKLFLKLD